MNKTISITKTTQYTDKCGNQIVKVDFTYNYDDGDARIKDKWRVKFFLNPISVYSYHPEKENGFEFVPDNRIWYRENFEGKYYSSRNDLWKREANKRFAHRLYNHVLRLIKKGKVQFDEEFFWNNDYRVNKNIIQKSEEVVID